MSNEIIRTLYVEDDNTIQKLMHIIFKKYGITDVTVASNGEEALEYYKNNKRFDLVITDVMMPKMDGFTLVKEIRQFVPKQTFMLVTALEDREELIKAIKLKIHYFIEKPINPKTFYEVYTDALNSILQKRELYRSNVLLKQYKEAIDKSTVLSKTDTNGLITYANQKFCELSQYNYDELIGKSHNIVRHLDMSKETFEDLWKSIKSKKEWHGKIKNRAKDGSTYIVDANISPLLDENGETIEYIALRHNITELELYKEVLQSKLDTTHQSLQENINLTRQYEESMNHSIAVLRTDTSNQITFANEKFCTLSGYRLTELIGMNCSKLRADKHIKERHCKIIKENLTQNQHIKTVFENIDKNGNAFYTDTVIYPIVNTQNITIEHLHLMHDITEIVSLNEEIKETQKEVVYTMGAIGETRSKETGNHVKRVAEYSYLLARLIGLSQEESNLLKQASPMHDIGKVGIPDAVLNKPGKLDEEEWEVMKTHAKLGYDMLKHSKREILRTAATVAYEHHEKYNGTGYPRGLKGENIHIYGRITAVADVFDALGSDRVYKKAWQLPDILDLLEREKGEHFDPILINLFMDNLDQFLAVRDRFKDNASSKKETL